MGCVRDSKCVIIRFGSYMDFLMSKSIIYIDYIFEKMIITQTHREPKRKMDDVWINLLKLVSP